MTPSFKAQIAEKNNDTSLCTAVVTDLEFKIVRSDKRRTLTITIERGPLACDPRAEGMSDHDVHRLIDAKRQWIVEKARRPQEYKDRMPPGNEVVSGESAPYLRRDYRVRGAENGKGPRHSAMVVKARLVADSITAVRRQRLSKEVAEVMEAAKAQGPFVFEPPYAERDRDPPSRRARAQHEPTQPD